MSDAIDEKKIAAMYSVDLSAAFDIVNRELLFKRLRIYGFNEEFLAILEDWFTNRVAYVECESKSSMIFAMTFGTLQGSVLGPILFALFILPIFEIEDLDAYADDNYVIKIASNLAKLEEQVSRSINTVLKWLHDSGMVVNIPKLPQN